MSRPGHICSATRSATCALVAVTLVGVATEAIAMLTITSRSVAFEAYIETGLELVDTTFLDYVIIPRIFLSMKVFPSRMLTASLSTIWIAAALRNL